jgi:hemerythrin-like domain-containing protein
MPIQIGQKADHGFDEPLGLLSDCHRRIEHFLRVLTVVATEAAGGPLSADYRRALEGALKYFAEAAPRHTADEEASLFPRMRQSGNPAAAAALTALDALEHDHDDAEARHAAVDALTRRWLEAGQLDASETAALREHLARLQALYARHIAIEDREVFPLAAQVLDAEQIAAVGREMAERRNVRRQAQERPGQIDSR